MKAGKVIGLGLNKTGTTTLARCLAILGYQRPLSCRPDLLAAYRRGQIEPVLDAIEDCGYCEDFGARRNGQNVAPPPLEDALAILVTSYDAMS